MKKIRSEPTRTLKLFDTDDEKLEKIPDKVLDKVPEQTKFYQPEVSFVKQEDKPSFDQTKPDMSFAARFEDPADVVQPEIKFAAVQKMSPSFEEAKLISPISTSHHHHHEESSFGSSSVFQEPQHDYHDSGNRH